MTRTVLILLAITMVSALTLGMAFSFNLTTQEMVDSIEQVPGQYESTDIFPDSSGWREAYDLELTGTGITPEAVSFDRDTAAVLDRTQQEALLVDLRTKNFTRLPALPGQTQAILADEDEIFVYADGVYRYSRDKDTWVAEVANIFVPAPVSQLRLFDDNFYLFGDALAYKISTKGESAGRAESWIDEGETWPTQLTDVYLDGYVYLSTPEGVTRWRRGEPTAWPSEATPSAHMYLTGDGDETIWCLDASTGHLSTLSDSGELVAVTGAPQLTGARFLGYHPDDDLIFTLIDRKIYQYPHLTRAPSDAQTVSD